MPMFGSIAGAESVLLAFDDDFETDGRDGRGAARHRARAAGQGHRQPDGHDPGLRRRAALRGRARAPRAPSAPRARSTRPCSRPTPPASGPPTSAATPARPSSPPTSWAARRRSSRCGARWAAACRPPCRRKSGFHIAVPFQPDVGLPGEQCPPRRTPPSSRRVAGTIRAFALLEDPELESRITREVRPGARGHHRRQRVFAADAQVRALRRRSSPGGGRQCPPPLRAARCRRSARAGSSTSRPARR